MKWYKVIIFSLILSMSGLCSAYDRSSSSVMVFVSFSMPKESLKAWMHEAQKIHAPIILRGLINNSFKDTQKAIFDLIKEDHSLGGMQIDPLSFKKFNISKVPAVVLTRDREFDVIYGNVTFDYALKKLHEANHD